jgi:hypothetical protein
VFVMVQTVHGSPNHISPARSQTMPPFERPSPATSQRESPPPDGAPPRTVSCPRMNLSPPHNKSFKKPRRKKSAKIRKWKEKRNAPRTGPPHQKTSIPIRLYSALPPPDPHESTRLTLLRRHLRPHLIKAFRVVSHPV